MTVFDIGANIGYLTSFLAGRIGATGRVYAFEPDPDNFEEILYNKQKNEISHCNPINSAVGSFIGFVPFSYGINGNVDTSGTSKSNCKITTLDSFVEENRIRRVDLVKIDVEGYELEVLKGMDRILSSVSKPILYLEVHPLDFRGMGDPVRVCSVLEQYYGDIHAYHTLRNFKKMDLSLYKRYLSRMAPKDLLLKCGETTLEYVKKNDKLRYHLLCLS